MPSLPTVLVTDGEHRAALAITRSLGRAGYRVVVASSRKHCLAGASRWASARLIVPDPLADAEGFVAVLAAASVGRVAILLPVADQSIVPILENRLRFPSVIIPLPPAETWHRLADKRKVLEEASALGIPTPRQVSLTRRTNAAAVSLTFPVVVKPSRSLVISQGHRMRTTVRHAADPDELDRILAGLPDDTWPVLVQQRVVGPGMGVFLLMANGKPMACFGHRRILEKPPAGGVSVWSESVAVDPAWLDRSTALLRRLNWEGVAMVEYKQDRNSGERYLMEVNGRFWGSLQLAIDAGVDFPRLLVERALSLPVRRTVSWRVGVQSRWRLGEIDHLLTRLRHSSRELALPPDIPSLGRVLRHTLTPACKPGAKGEIFRWADPMPGVLELVQWISASVFPLPAGGRLGSSRAGSSGGSSGHPSSGPS